MQSTNDSEGPEHSWDRLYKRGVIAAARRQVLHEKHVQEENSKKEHDEDAALECTFHPRINLTSSSVTEAWNEPTSGAAFNRLYLQGFEQSERRLRQQQYRDQLEAERIQAQRDAILKHVHGDDSTPLKSEAERNELFQRLAKPQPKTDAQKKRQEDFLRHSEHSYRPTLSPATHRLWEQSQRRREAEELIQQEEKKRLEAQAQRAKRALQVIRQRGGPTCVSGNTKYNCPEHRHDAGHPPPRREGSGAAAVTSRNQNDTVGLDSGRASTAQPRKSARVGGPATAVTTSQQAKMKRVGVSDHLLAIPEHRISQRCLDPARPGWPEDSPFFAYLAPRDRKPQPPLVEPASERLTLDDLARHDLLLRATTSEAP